MTERLEFIANLCQRQSALMLSGQGDRCLIELEAFQLDAQIALIGMAKFANRPFRVIIEELTRVDDEAGNKPERKTIRVGRRGAAN